MTLSRALSLFEAALALPPEQREAFLHAQTNDPTALIEVQSLLAAHQASAGFLEYMPEVFPQRILGAYRLLKPLGAGGMGRVYLAERADGAFHQQVAIKVLASTLADADSVRRAEAERNFLARLEHPHIAHILDGGSTPEGQPYVVMEYVDGQSIDQFCQAQRLDLRARILLFLQVLAAVEAAHRALIVHRDIKPSNILVTHAGQAKLLDFGIAKSLDGSIAGNATQGQRGPLTPDYASPEQLAGRPLNTACDVYSLGLVLYELLTGHRAHVRTHRTLAEIEHAITSQPPSLPSGNLDAQKLSISPREQRDWRRRMTGDLDRVLLKALEPEPTQRYGSAQVFAEDLQRWLEGRPVAARAAGALDRSRKFVKRNRLAVSAAAAVLLSLSIGLLLAAEQARIARSQADSARRANRFLVDMIGNADLLVSGQMPSLMDALDRAAPTIPERLGGQPQLEGEVRLALGRAYLSLEKLDAAGAQLRPAEALLKTCACPSYADAQMQLAILDWWAGHDAEAERRMQSAIALLNANPQTSDALASALNTYAALLNDMGRFNDAIAIIARTQRLIDAGALISARERAGLLGNLGYARDGLGQIDAAISAHTSALHAFEQALPPVHPDIAVSLNNLAMALQTAGRRDEALAAFRRSLEIRRAFAGADNSMTVKAQTNLAAFLAENGQHNEARAMIAEALAHAAKAYGPDHVALANTHAAAAHVAMATHDTASAIEQANAALALYATVETVDPHYPARARATLAQAQAQTHAQKQPGARK